MWSWVNDLVYFKCNHVVRCCVGVILQSSVMTSHLLKLASVFQEHKDPSLRGVRQHLTKNNILSHGLRLLSSNHVKEFGVFFLHWNPTPSNWKLLVAETRSPQPQKLPAHSFYKHRCHEATNGKVVSNNWCYRQAALLHPHNVSRPFARQIQHDAGQRPPQGNIYQLLHLDPLVLTLDLLPWHTPFTSLLLHLTGNGIDTCVLQDGCSLLHHCGNQTKEMNIIKVTDRQTVSSYGSGYSWRSTNTHMMTDITSIHFYSQKCLQKTG